MEESLEEETIDNVPPKYNEDSERRITHMVIMVKLFSFNEFGKWVRSFI